MLAIARAPDSALWVGTYGQGIFVLRKGAGSWERVRSSSDTAARAISWDYVHAFGFGPRGQIWYGTVGNGWGLSTDGGKTWKNWGFSELGPEWQYVAPNGIVTRGDTTYIGTADGIKLTWDDGQTWRVITSASGAATARDSVWGHIANEYVLTLGLTERGLFAAYPSGLGGSDDGGRTWRHAGTEPRPDMDRRFRAAVQSSPQVTKLCSDPNIIISGPNLRPDSLRGTPWGLLRRGEPWGCVTVPRAGATVAARSPRIEPLYHSWFRRPIALKDQPYIDQTYRYGSTMGGNFQPHQGVEFNNRSGTTVYAIDHGVVVYAGPAERGALTVAIKHNRRVGHRGGQYLWMYSVYYHNSKLLARVGQIVSAGDMIAEVGNTGRATNEHLHLEIHASPHDSVHLIVNPEVRYPPYTVNPELWVEPLPGTGVLVGQVWDAHGEPVQQARIYGLVKPEPQETPFSFIETYGPRNQSDPTYQEHFAISDVPPGIYVLGTEIGGKRVLRQVRVEAGKVTWVEFSP